MVDGGGWKKLQSNGTAQRLASSFATNPYPHGCTVVGASYLMQVFFPSTGIALHLAQHSYYPMNVNLQREILPNKLQLPYITGLVCCILHAQSNSPTRKMVTDTWLVSAAGGSKVC